ncbi:hypothetical protein MBLNU230_g1100t1 [Neophaeotheca triangularis]
MSSIIDKAKDMISSSATATIAGHKVHNTGYGLMGLTWRPNPPSDETSFASMTAALDAKANFWNGGVFYSTPSGRNSLHLLHDYFDKNPGDASKVCLSIKGGFDLKAFKPNNSAEFIKSDIEEAAKILPKKKIDVFEPARVDPTVPIEVTMEAMKECVDKDLIGGISLSECSASTVRRAAAVAKIEFVEVEFSLFSLDIMSNGVAAACAELEIPIVAYAPLGRGMLTGQIKSPDDLEEGDLRKGTPRFQPDQFHKNMELVSKVEDLAAGRKCTPGQVAVAWVKAQSQRNGNPIIIPIPGASSPERVKENCTEVELSELDLKELESILAGFETAGARYGGAQEQILFGDSKSLEEWKAENGK